MKQLFLLLFFVFLFAACKQAKTSSTVFNENLQNPEDVAILPNYREYVTKIKLEPTKEDIKASQFVSKTNYIFLETTSESLIGLYRNIMIYKNRIFISDDIISNNVFIFDITGKFIRSIPKGQGPGECVRVRGMFVDKRHDLLVVRDMEQRKFMYYSLDGEFTGKSIDIQLYFSGQYAIVNSGAIVYSMDSDLENPHVPNLRDYRLLYTDSLGCVKGASIFYDDNKDIPTAWSCFSNGGDDILFYPKYTNDIYCVTEGGADLKYSIDLSAYSPVDIEYIQSSLHSYPELKEYLEKKTLLIGYFSETKDYFYFAVEDRTKRIYSFYNKRTKQICSFSNLIFDTDFIVDFPSIFSDGEHFVGAITPQKLKDLNEYRKKEKRPLDKELEEKIINLQEDDNAPLVLFTLK